MYRYFILVCCYSEVKKKRKVHFEFSPRPRFRISPQLIILLRVRLIYADLRNRAEKAITIRPNQSPHSLY